MGYDAVGKIYVPVSELSEFFLKYLPSSGAKVSFDLQNMKLNGDDLEVNYAAGSECHPCEWAELPPWLKG